MQFHHSFLIDQRGGQYRRFEGGGSTKKLWIEILTKLKDAHRRTSKPFPDWADRTHLQYKWQELKKGYNKAKAKAKKSGEGKVTWRFYEQMKTYLHPIEKSDASVRVSSRDLSGTTAGGGAASPELVEESDQDLSKWEKAVLVRRGDVSITNCSDEEEKHTPEKKKRSRQELLDASRAFRKKPKTDPIVEAFLANSLAKQESHRATFLEGCSIVAAGMDNLAAALRGQPAPERVQKTSGQSTPSSDSTQHRSQSTSFIRYNYADVEDERRRSDEQDAFLDMHYKSASGIIDNSPNSSIIELTDS